MPAPEPTDNQPIRSAVRARYAEAARAIALATPAQGCCSPAASAAAPSTSSCCAPAVGPAASSPVSCCAPGDEPAPRSLIGPEHEGIFGSSLYDGREVAGVRESALGASLGCGVPTSVADLQPGEVVLDLGSGAGADVLLAAAQVGPDGRAIGLDMTEEMLDLARRHATEAGVTNAEFLHGYLEEIPLPEASVDVIVSNCVLNLAADKHVVLAEAFRVLRPGGRLAISDVVASEEMSQETRAEMAAWTGCIAGALTQAQYQSALVGAGFVDVEVKPTHSVHEAASAATIQARKPD